MGIRAMRCQAPSGVSRAPHMALQSWGLNLRRGLTVHDFGEDALKKVVTTAFAGNQAMAGSRAARTERA